jgi:Zn-dependent peptidase ImmA (M78 family)/transcriptional regulator with XRE-family HTH domain
MWALDGDHLLMRIAGQLKRLRLGRGRSLQQVADAVGVSKPHIWEIESGRSNASLELVGKLARYFEVSVSTLLGESLGTSESLVFGREFNSASDEIKRQIIEMTERLLDDTGLRMKLADRGSPEVLANTIVEHYGPALPIPIPVQNIAEAVGISEINPITAADFEGLLITDSAKTKGTIVYNAESSLERRRFTIAHEIGHFLLPFHDSRAQCAKNDLGIIRSVDARRAREAEANRFAAALLLPQQPFRADIRRLGKPDTRHILKLADKYNTSKEATARRYAELSDDPCAIIFSRNGQTRSYCKTNGLPRLSCAPKKPLPQGSSTVKTAIKQLPVGTLSTWEEIDASIWFESGVELQGITVYEQFLQQANGYRLTMLTIELDDEEEMEGDDDLQHGWAVDFRR